VKSYKNKLAGNTKNHRPVYSTYKSNTIINEGFNGGIFVKQLFFKKEQIGKDVIKCFFFFLKKESDMGLELSPFMFGLSLGLTIRHV
jgi:hypothetical protein